MVELSLQRNERRLLAGCRVLHHETERHGRPTTTITTKLVATRHAHHKVSIGLVPPREHEVAAARIKIRSRKQRRCHARQASDRQIGAASFVERHRQVHRHGNGVVCARHRRRLLHHARVVEARTADEERPCLLLIQEVGSPTLRLPELGRRVLGRSAEAGIVNFAFKGVDPQAD